MKGSRTRLRFGDFSRIYSEHRERVRAQLLRTVAASDVDDVLQQVFAKAARALPEFRGEAAITTWLHQIAQRTALDHLRSRHHHEQQRTTPLENEGPERCACGCAREPSPSIPAEAPQRLVQAEMCDCIREFIGRLSPEHAEVLALKEIEGLTNPEIATRLGITVHAAKIRLHRARAAMRQLVEADCEVYRTPNNTLACDRKPRQPGRQRS